MALRGLLGEGAPLSASSIQRLKAKWLAEYEELKREDLSELKLKNFDKLVRICSRCKQMKERETDMREGGME